MTIKYKLMVFVFGTLFFYKCGIVQDSGSLGYKSGGVITENNTALRITPLVFSGVIARLEKGRPVEITDRSAEKSRIARTTDYWYHVKLQDGMTGWVYGQNLRLVDIKNSKQLNDLISEFREFEASGFSKAVAGKWWSVNSFGDFTEHALEFYEDNKYKSYYKGQEKNPIEGEFTADFNKSEVIFPQGTTFKQNLKFAQRGDSYVLYTQSGEKEISFTRIQEGTEENMLGQNVSEKKMQEGSEESTLKQQQEQETAKGEISGIPNTEKAASEQQQGQRQQEKSENQ